MYSDTINQGLAQGHSFKATFAEEAAEEDLDDLRRTFRIKAYQRRQEAVIRHLMERGWTRSGDPGAGLPAFGDAGHRRSGDRPPAHRYLEIRAEYGGPTDAAFTSAEGGEITAETFADYLSLLRRVRINTEFNGSLCRGLLQARYGDTDTAPDGGAYPGGLHCRQGGDWKFGRKPLMPKMMLHRAEARAALGRGVAKLTLAVQGTLGPKGMNAIIDRPIGTPIVSRDGVSIADEVELPCRFENMGAQVVREVSKQTNEVAGDGTTTATVLANALIQDGLKVLESDTSPVDLVAGIDRAAGVIAEALRRSAKPLSGQVSSKRSRQSRQPTRRLAGWSPKRWGASGPTASWRSSSVPASRPRWKWSRACRSTGATSRTTWSPMSRQCGRCWTIR